MPCKMPAYTVYHQTHFNSTTVTTAYSTTAQGDLKDQLRKCWKRHYDWTLLPAHVQNFSFIARNYYYHTFLSFFMFAGGKHCSLTDSFQLGLQGCGKLAQRATFSRPLCNSRTSVISHLTPIPSK